MSYEITGARVRDLRDRIWTLDEVTFTGAAVLRRDKAAYQNTSIELINDLYACHPERGVSYFAERRTWAGRAHRSEGAQKARVGPASLIQLTRN